VSRGDLVVLDVGVVEGVDARAPGDDTVILRGHCEPGGVRVGFGEVSGKLLPASA
jgi:hypothetical protein